MQIYAKNEGGSWMRVYWVNRSKSISGVPVESGEDIGGAGTQISVFGFAGDVFIEGVGVALDLQTHRHERIDEIQTRLVQLQLVPAAHRLHLRLPAPYRLQHPPSLRLHPLPALQFRQRNQRNTLLGGESTVVLLHLHLCFLPVVLPDLSEQTDPLFGLRPHRVSIQEVIDIEHFRLAVHPAHPAPAAVAVLLHPTAPGRPPVVAVLGTQPEAGLCVVRPVAVGGLLEEVVGILIEQRLLLLGGGRYVQIVLALNIPAVLLPAVTLPRGHSGVVLLLVEDLHLAVQGVRQRDVFVLGGPRLQVVGGVQPVVDLDHRVFVEGKTLLVLLSDVPGMHVSIYRSISELTALTAHKCHPLHSSKQVENIKKG